jgi:uncharacterized membrane protein
MEMRDVQDRQIHKLFQISIVLKGAHALIECVGGIALALTNTAAIARLVGRLTQNELSRNPHDFIATHLYALAQGFSVEAKHFYAYYLLSHGVVQLLLVIGLLRGKLWAYPVSLVVMGLFIVYQLYRYSFTHGIGLLVLTIFDIIVIGLIWQEYRLVRHHLPAKGVASPGR